MLADETQEWVDVFDADTEAAVVDVAGKEVRKATDGKQQVPGGAFLLPRKLLHIRVVDPVLQDYYADHGPQHRGDSGVDLFCPKDVTVVCGQTVMLDLGIQCEMLDATGGAQSFYLHPRSSLSKTPLMMANSAGVIDAGYRGNLKAAVRYVPTNRDLEELLGMACLGTMRSLPTFTIKKGTRLFQVCAPSLDPMAVRVVDQLTTSDRGDGGFGSTGQ